jgi:hypothetical protein
MSLIFDSFPSQEKAEAFAAAVTQRFGLQWQIFDNPVEAHNHDPFIYEQIPPIVHVDRVGDDDAKRILAAEGLTRADCIARSRSQHHELSEAEYSARYGGDDDSGLLVVSAEHLVEKLATEFGGVFAGT